MQESVREGLGHVGGFAKHFTGECLDLLDLSGAFGVLLDREIVSKLILILLPQEVNEELTPSEDFGLHDTRQKLLIVDLLLV